MLILGFLGCCGSACESMLVISVVSQPFLHFMHSPITVSHRSSHTSRHQNSSHHPVLHKSDFRKLHLFNYHVWYNVMHDLDIDQHNASLQLRDNIVNLIRSELVAKYSQQQAIQDVLNTIQNTVIDWLKWNEI